MNWNGTQYGMTPVERRFLRASRARARELEREAAEAAKLSLFRQAQVEVATYENRIQILLSVHKEEPEQWHWEVIRAKTEPVFPERAHANENSVRRRFAALPPIALPSVKPRQFEEEALHELKALPPLESSPPRSAVREQAAASALKAFLDINEKFASRTPQRLDTHAADARRALDAQPEYVQPSYGREAAVQARIDSYRPSFIERLTGTARTTRATLEKELLEARVADKAEYVSALENYNLWMTERARLKQAVADAEQLDEAEYQGVVQEYSAWSAEKSRLEEAVAAAREMDEADYRRLAEPYIVLRSKHLRAETALSAARALDKRCFNDARAALLLLFVRRVNFETELASAMAADEAAYHEAVIDYRRAQAVWLNEQALANGVLSGDFEAYSRVLRELGPFAELTELGSLITFRFSKPTVMEVELRMDPQQAVPSEVKTLTASGKLSVKPMPKRRFIEIYHDYVAGCLLRVAREVFALLPIETVIATAWTHLFDAATGNSSEQAILSVVMPRKFTGELNFNSLDPSEAMENFLHRGDFKLSRKSGTFSSVTPLTTQDLDVPHSNVPSTNPFPARWVEGLRRGDVESGFLRLTANELAGLLGKESKDNFTLPESKALARSTEDFGYCLEPDPRYGAGNFWGNRELGIFQPPSGDAAEPSENFLGASALLQLCLLVAAADGAVDLRELNQFRRFIESQFQFTPDEHQRFVVLETLLARNAASAKVTLGRTAKRVPKEKHIVIGQLLVDIAAADGVISPPEHKALSRIFDALGLRAEMLDTLIRNLASSASEVVIQRAEKPVAGEAIPAAQQEVEVSGFKLDMARVAAISAETHEVIGLLAKAMAEDDDGGTGYQLVPPANPRDGTVTMSLAESGILSASNGSVVPSGRLASGTGESLVQPTEEIPHIELLDVKFHSVTLRLIARDAWTRAEFEALVREHHLMPLSVFDVINEWADEHHGDFLLEGEETIVVHRSILNP